MVILYCLTFPQIGIGQTPLLLFLETGKLTILLPFPKS